MKVMLNRTYRGNYVWAEEYGWGPFEVVDETPRCYTMEMKNKWFIDRNSLLKDRFIIIGSNRHIPNSQELDDLL